MALSPEELRDLRTAKGLLENPGLAARISTLVGTSVELVLKKLPSPLNGTILEQIRQLYTKL